jgi:hypothetical protein
MISAMRFIRYARAAALGAIARLTVMPGVPGPGR